MAIELNAVVIEPELIVGVSIPEIGTGLNIPGVPPNTSSLSTNVTTQDITTATTIPELVSGITQTELLSTVAGVVNSEPTPGNFITRFDEVTASLFEYKQIGKAVDDSLINLEILNFDVAKVILDSNINTESVSKTFIRSILDSLFNTDSNYFYINKSVLDINASQETKQFNVGKTLSDTINISIALIFSSQTYKSFADYVISAEYPSFNFGGLQQDNFIASDQFSRLVNYIRSYTDSNVNSDSNTLTTGLNKQDSIIISSVDNITKLASFQRSFEDIIAVTDDYYGTATIDDDQYVTVGKTLTPEIVSILEQPYFYTNTVLIDLSTSIDFTTIKTSKSVSDSVSINSAQTFNNVESLTIVNIKNILDNILDIEAKYFNIDKRLQDQLISIEISSHYANKILLDTTAIIDTNIFAVNKSTIDVLVNTEYNNFNSSTLKQDSTQINDQFARLVNYIRDYNDSNISSDSNTINIGLNKQDTVNISSIDAISKLVNFIRNLQDNVKATDDYYGAATIDDDQYATVGKTLTLEILRATDTLEAIAEYIRRLVDSARFTETKVFSVQPVKSDTLRGIDSLTYIITTILNLTASLTDTLVTNEDFSRLVSYIRAYSDSSIGTETKTFSSQLLKSDVNNNTEVFSRLVNYIRNYNDTNINTETRTFLSQISKSDITNSTELQTFSLEFLKSDIGNSTETKQFLSKPTKSDILLSTDTLTYIVSGIANLTATPVDTVRSTDSGTINTQNYFASSYVTPGYAGTNVTFGV